MVKADVYVYKVKAKDVFNVWHDILGKITMINNLLTRKYK